MPEAAHTGAGMRIRIPRRFMLLGVLLCALAFAFSAPQATYAKPIPWNDDNGPPLSGDGDGPVVKGSGPTTSSRFVLSSDVARTTRTVTTISTWKSYLMALRLGIGWRWIW
jgi:hypothetical protein